MVSAIFRDRTPRLPKKWLAVLLLALAGSGLAVVLTGVLSAQAELGWLGAVAEPSLSALGGSRLS